MGETTMNETSSKHDGVKHYHQCSDRPMFYVCYAVDVKDCKPGPKIQPEELSTFQNNLKKHFYNDPEENNND